MSDSLNKIAQRAVDDPFFFAGLLTLYAKSENLSQEQLAMRIGCTTETVMALFLCRAPRQNPPADFQQDIDAMANRFNISPELLSEIARRGHALQAMQASSALGGLMAARDAEEESEEDQ